MTIKIRRSKKEVVDRERELAARTSIDAATQQEISLSQQAYVHAARWFESNVATDLQRKARNAKRLAAFFGVLSFMSIAAVMGLTPLKTVETYLVRVDNNSGYTDVVKPLSQIKSTEQIDDEYWLSAYVRFRESYSFAGNSAQYHMVELMSYEDTFAEYKNFQLSTKGYLAVLGDKRQIGVVVNNINFLERKDGQGTAQVRITKTVLDNHGVPDPQLKPAVWIDTITYDYKNPTKNAGDQWLNPRAFGIKSFTPTQEVGVSHDK